MAEPAAPPPVDFYNRIHKSLRRQLFLLSNTLGSADYTDAATVQAIGQRLRNLIQALREHGTHEDTLFHPPFAQRHPEDYARLTKEHQAQEPLLAGLEKQLAAFQAGPSPDTLSALYRDVNNFIARYLVHIADEEALMPVLQKTMPHEELMGALRKLVTARTPQESLADLEGMLPALTPQERLGLLGMLKATAPAPFFDTVLSVASRVLEPPDWQWVQARLSGK